MYLGSASGAMTGSYFADPYNMISWLRDWKLVVARPYVLPGVVMFFL